MKGLRVFVSLFSMIIIWSVTATAQAQDPGIRVDINVGAVFPKGEAESVGTAGGTPILLKQKSAPMMNIGVGYVPDNRWGFQVRGSHFATSAKEVVGVLDPPNKLMLWGVDPDIELFCSSRAICVNGKTSYGASDTKSRTRLDFLATRTWASDEGDKRRYLSAGLSYLGYSRQQAISGAWQKTIFDKPSGVAIDERLEMRTDSLVRLKAVGLTVAGEVETCLNGSWRLDLRGQGTKFLSGSANRNGKLTPRKWGTLSNGLGGFSYEWPLEPLADKANANSAELDASAALRFVTGRHELGFGVGWTKLTGLPTAHYVVPAGRAAVFGAWQTGTVSESHVRLFGQYVVRF